jgi:hypothetical protein
VTLIKFFVSRFCLLVCIVSIFLYHSDVLRNSLTLSQTVDKIDYFSLCVLVASLSGSLIGLFAVILRQLELACSINTNPDSFQDLTDDAVPKKNASWGADKSVASSIELASFIAPPRPAEIVATVGRRQSLTAATNRGSVFQPHGEPWFGVDRAREYAPLPAFFTGAQNLTMPSYLPRRYK